MPPAMTDSIKKLSIPVQAFRAKIVAYLMTPKPAGEGIVAVRQLTLRLKKLVDEACRRMYDQDWKPENVSVNFLHLKSWETITSKMNISERREYKRLLEIEREADRGILMVHSLEFKSYWEKKRGELVGTQVAMVDAILKESKVKDNKTKLVLLEKDRIGQILMDVWKATSVGKLVSARDLAAMIVKLWVEAGDERHRYAAQKWCESKHYDFEAMCSAAAHYRNA